LFLKIQYKKIIHPCTFDLMCAYSFMSCIFLPCRWYPFLMSWRRNV